jgi:hypothetical protein
MDGRRDLRPQVTQDVFKLAGYCWWGGRWLNAHVGQFRIPDIGRGLRGGHSRT